MFRKQQHQNRRDSLCQRRHDISDVTKRNFQNTNNHRPIRSSVWGQDQHIEVKSLGSRRVGIQYHRGMKILGAHFTNSVKQSAEKCWTKLTGVLSAEARDTYSRELCLVKRIQYVHAYLLARAWYTAEIFPMPTDCTRQVNTAISCYIWRSEIFRVPISTLQRRK